MARKAGQGKEEEESRARQQEEKTPVRDEEKKPACHGRGHHVVEQDPYLSPCTKLKSKWIKDLNINPLTLNLIKEKVVSTLECIGTGDHFLNRTPIAQTLSATINPWDYMKLRSFCRTKDTITKTKCQPTEWEKIFTNPTSDRGLISRIYKELKKQDIKTSNSPIEKMGYKAKERIYGRRISNDQKTFKEVLNILTHQRNDLVFNIGIFH
ncbi:hypothetical protein STEG23_009664, partial [Scotinomys teguina]